MLCKPVETHSAEFSRGQVINYFYKGAEYCLLPVVLEQKTRKINKGRNMKNEEIPGVSTIYKTPIFSVKMLQMNE